MHGVILLEFGRFVDAQFGAPVWKEVVTKAGLTNPIFIPSQIYPDSDLFGIVSALSQKSGREPGSLLEDFGVYVVPSLASLYAAFIDAEWKLLDLLEHTESVIHRVVRMRAPGSAPPRLRCRRLAADEVELVYDSERKLCALARGIIRGLAKLYEESVTMAEPECMLKGQAACLIRVKKSLLGGNP